MRACAEQRQAFERAEARRAAEAAEMAFRQDARQQQAHHLSEVSALTREVRCWCMPVCCETVTGSARLPQGSKGPPLV